MVIELFAPQGTLSVERWNLLGRRLVADVMREQSAPATVLQAAQALCQVIVHEPAAWTVGAHPAEPGRYLVRVSVPESWREQMSGYLIARITAVLAESDPDPGRLHREPLTWVHVVGIPDGSYGILGQAQRSTDLIKMITQPYRESSGDRVPAPGTAIDPVCGMTVALTDSAITFEHDGTSYAFCSSGCRETFLELAHDEPRS